MILSKSSMKRLFQWGVLGLLAFVFASCGLNKQKSALKNFENCKIEVVGVNEMKISGSDLTPLLQGNALDINQLPGLAMGFLTGKLPFETTIQIQIHNPTKRLAGVKEFEYKIAIENHELLSGLWTQPIEVLPGETIIVPVPIKTDVYAFVSDRNVLQKVMQFFQESSTAEPVKLNLQLKPTLELGNKKVAYPRFISFERKITPEMFKK
jgi:hypothetical protein